MKVLIIGCGNVGANVAVMFARANPSVEITVADINVEIAKSIAAVIGKQATPLALNFLDAPSLVAAVRQHQVVVNMCGPFYKSALPIINICIDHGVSYLDINDDDDVAKEVFLNSAYDERAKRKQCSIMLGCGTSPGFSNILSRHAANQLDSTQSIRLAWVIPYASRAFSAGAVDHIFHMITGKVTQFLDGRYQDVSPREGVRHVEFIPPFGSYPAYYSGHAEPITLPKYVDGVKEVSIRSCFYPQAHEDIIQKILDLGLDSRKPVEAVGISPLQFTREFLKSDEGFSKLLESDKIQPFGCANQVEVIGVRDGKTVRIIYEDHGFFDPHGISAEAQMMGETTDPTAVCARLALEEFMAGRNVVKGVVAAEGWLATPSYINKVIEQAGKKYFHREDIIGELTAS